MKGKQIILLLAVCLGLAACSPDESNTTIGVEETSAPMVTTVEETSAAPTTEASAAFASTAVPETTAAGSTTAAAVLSHDFDRSSNLKKVVRQVCFEVPEKWTETRSGDDLIYYYPSGAMMMVQYLDNDKADFTNETVQQAFLDGVAQSYTDYQLIRSYTEEIASQNIFRFSFSGQLQGQLFLMDGAVIAMDEGICNIMFGTVQPAAVDYSEDFQAVLDSIEIKDSENPSVDSPQAEPAAETTVPAAVAQGKESTKEDSGVEKVWISKSGKKYHRNSSCSNMKNPKQIPIDEAEAQGRQPCKKCY